jgi:branched-chain amino acid transport system permease protein
MSAAAASKVWLLHVAVIGVLAALQFVLPDYHHGVVAKVMVLAVFAVGYNLLFGYAGLLSLGHAMFFAAGLYGTGLAMQHLGWGAPLALIAGVAAGALLSLIIGLLALRTSGVAFMIVTMMFSQVLYLTILYFSRWTMGDQGFVLPQGARTVELAGLRLDLIDPTTRYWCALALFALALFASLAIVRSRYGRVLVAIRENEERTRMLGYDTFSSKLVAVVVSGTISAAAGASYALLFGYVGASFASIQYSILPLLWVLLGGAATTLGPLAGTLFMQYAVDVASGFTSAWLLLVGLALILLVLFFPRGMLGTVPERWFGSLP